ncbi:MAG TPA: hypothetical protein PLD85_13665, partial [Spirochaetota bacterium]|nr:hypothetical protein [Spirochaetota bacterium]
RAYSREQVEVFCEGKSIVLKDFRITICYINGKRKTFKTFSQEMGYKEELTHFIDIICNERVPLLNPLEIFCSTKATFAINESLKKGSLIKIPCYI